MKKRIITCFNAGAKSYDSAADVQVVAAKHLATQLTGPANDILEIGCGTGLFSQFLVRQFPGKKIVLTDIAAEMINVTKAKFLNSPNVTAICMDGEHLAMNQSYDLITSNMAIHWFTDVNKSVNKMMDSLKPKGQLIFSILGENSLKEWRRLYPVTLAFPKKEILAEQFPELAIQVVQHSQLYANRLDFLRTLKAIGGTASRMDTLLPARQLRNLIRENSAPFTVTYEIIYGHYRKP